MKDGANFLITGNALEVFGKRIEDVDGTIVDGLGLVDITTKRDMMNRFNSLYIGTFDSGKQQSGDAAGGADPMKIVGFKSQFTSFLLGRRHRGIAAVYDRTGAGTQSGDKRRGYQAQQFHGHICDRGLSWYSIRRSLGISCNDAAWRIRH